MAMPDPTRLLKFRPSIGEVAEKWQQLIAEGIIPSGMDKTCWEIIEYIYTTKHQLLNRGSAPARFGLALLENKISASLQILTLYYSGQIWQVLLEDSETENLKVITETIMSVLPSHDKK